MHLQLRYVQNDDDDDEIGIKLKTNKQTNIDARIYASTWRKTYCDFGLRYDFISFNELYTNISGFSLMNMVCHKHFGSLVPFIQTFV